uniref:IF rod domain-containing protein n=1 Tax=Macrostomum lignano TaxID=282301 RepID=A0A1I8GUV3_9PLAT
LCKLGQNGCDPPLQLLSALPSPCFLRPGLGAAASSAEPLVTHAGIQTLVRFIGSFSSGTTLGGAMASKTTTKTTRYSMQTSGAPEVVINRTLPGFGIGRGDTVDSVKSVRVTRSMASASGIQQTNAEVNNMLNGREKEKKDMQELNERFANYIEKVRFLEAQNKKLSNELQQLKDRWGKETERVKQTYETELAQLRKLLDDSEKQKAEAEVRISSSLEDQLNELQVLLDEANRQHQVDRETIDKLNQQLADYDGEISLLRRGRDQNQKEIKRLRDEVNRLRGDLDAETLNHINAENEAQSLREQLEFMKQIHESELKEKLAALAYRDTTSENARILEETKWPSTAARSSASYDNKMDVMRSEIESQYSMKARTTNTAGTTWSCSHLREENKRIKGQMTGRAQSHRPELRRATHSSSASSKSFRREMEEAERELRDGEGRLRTGSRQHAVPLWRSTSKELQTLMDMKLSLELGDRRIQEASGRRGDPQINPAPSDAGTDVAKVFYCGRVAPFAVEQQGHAHRDKRTAKGNVSIQECSADGKREDISGWRLLRNNIDNGSEASYHIKFTVPNGVARSTVQIHLFRAEVFISHYFKRPSVSLQIWARGLKRPAATTWKLLESSWGVGANINTSLYNTEG